jgi:hypothetical protein
VVVIDILTPTRELNYIIRAHEGDRIATDPAYPEDLVIVRGDTTTLVGNEKRPVPGESIRVASEHIVERRQRTKFEPRVRPSLALVADPEKARLAELKRMMSLDIESGHP